jgi:tetratricopeptide (TPR) repeat protein
MSSHRPVILAGILLTLVPGLLCRAVLAQEVAPPDAMSSDISVPLAGQNSLSNLRVTQVNPGTWTADFDYFYTGQPESLHLDIDLPPVDGPSAPGVATSWNRYTYIGRAVRGAHHASKTINYPGSRTITRRVVARIVIPGPGGGHVIADQQVDQVIDWPDYPTWQTFQNSPEDNLKRAVVLIDSNDLVVAKSILELLIRENPRLDAAYVELARIAMKSNWGPEGLHQAEGLLSSALQIQPASADAKILLGYVYANQKRFAAAEAQFADAAKSNTSNPWLWTNWGQLLLMEGKTDQAIAKFRQGIERPIAHDRYDRAHRDAYLYLLELLGRRKDYDGMEALYKRRVAELGRGACYTSDYAQFMLQVRGDPQDAIDLARGALNTDCDDSDARQVLGLAEYVVWARATGPQKAAALNEARVYLPPGPMALYMLAASERTLQAAKQLLASGEQIDEKDNDGLTALAYALKNHDASAAKRLLELGAQPELAVGLAGIPAALIPVMESDLEGVRLMREHGVDYAKLKFHGATALDLAKQSGNTELLETLRRKGSVL